MYVGKVGYHGMDIDNGHGPLGYYHTGPHLMTIPNLLEMSSELSVSVQHSNYRCKANVP